MFRKLLIYFAPLIVLYAACVPAAEKHAEPTSPTAPSATTAPSPSAALTLFLPTQRPRTDARAQPYPLVIEVRNTGPLSMRMRSQASVVKIANTAEKSVHLPGEGLNLVLRYRLPPDARVQGGIFGNGKVEGGIVEIKPGGSLLVKVQIFAGQLAPGPCSLQAVVEDSGSPIATSDVAVVNCLGADEMQAGK
jgi:hypothetical protein